MIQTLFCDINITRNNKNIINWIKNNFYITLFKQNITLFKEYFNFL